MFTESRLQNNITRLADFHWTKKWICIKFAQCKYDAKMCLHQSKPILLPYLHTSANMVENMAFTAFATGLLLCKHIFASYLRCANLMQIHFFVQCSFHYFPKLRLIKARAEVSPFIFSIKVVAFTTLKESFSYK